MIKDQTKQHNKIIPVKNNWSGKPCIRTKGNFSLTRIIRRSSKPGFLYVMYVILSSKYMGFSWQVLEKFNHYKVKKVSKDS